MSLYWSALPRFVFCLELWNDWRVELNQSSSDDIGRRRCAYLQFSRNSSIIMVSSRGRVVLTPEIYAVPAPVTEGALYICVARTGDDEGVLSLRVGPSCMFRLLSWAMARLVNRAQLKRWRYYWARSMSRVQSSVNSNSAF